MMNNTFLQARKRFAIGLSLATFSLVAFLFYLNQRHNPLSTAQTVVVEMPFEQKNKAETPSWTSTQVQKSETQQNKRTITSVSEQKTDIDDALKPYKLNMKGHKSFEEEQAEKAEFSEERALFDFEMLKDPSSGTIPRAAPIMAAEAAQRVRATRANSSEARSAPMTIVPRGPNNLGGRTRTVGMDVRNANIMIAGSVSSGVFRSTNGGASWSRVAPIGQIHNVTAIAQDTRTGHEDTWYYGGGEIIGNSASLGSAYRGFGIWKSTDNGLSWAALPSTQTGAVLELFDNPFDYVGRIVVHPTTGNVLVAASNTIMQSTDGGGTWTSVLGTFTLANNLYTDVILTPTGRIYAAFDGRNPVAGVWTSTTGALGSWTQIATPGTTAGWHALNTYGRTVLCYAPSNPDIVFALYWNGISHTTANRVVEAKLFKWNQTTWTDLSANLPDEAGYSQGNDPFAVQTGYDLVVAVKPDDVNTVFVAGTNVYRSTSGFTTNTNTTRIGGYNSPANYALYPNHHPDNHALTFAPGDNNTLYTGSDGGIHKADITATSVVWTSLNNDYVTYQYYHADIEPKNGSSVVLGGAQDNGTTINPGGGSFSDVLGGDGCQTGMISYADAANFSAIVSTQSGNLYRLDGPGTGWVIRPSNSTGSIFVTYFQLDQDNTNLLYYADNVSIIRTRNGSGLTSGATGDPATFWQKMTALGLTGNIRAMSTSRNDAYAGAAYTASDPNRKLYIGTDQGRVYRLNDPAFVASTTVPVNISPTGFSAGATCSSIAVNPWDDNEIMVTYSNYGVISVFHTFNANSATPTWTAVEGPAGSPLQLGSARSCIITRVGTTTTYIVGSSVGLYSTQALTGTTTVWDQVGPNDINYAVCAAMRLRVSDNRIVLGTHGNGMFELQLPPAVAPSVTVTTVPAGLNISVDGTTYTSPKTFNWANLSVHTIATTTPQSPTAGTKYLFNNWSDAGALSHSVTATTASPTYTANFDTQHLLTTTSDCGTITPATGYQNAGNVVVTATPNPGYTLLGFTGGLTGTTNPQTLNLTAPTTVNASFGIEARVAIAASPSNSICGGASVTFTATPTNGGGTPQYKWFINGNEVVGQTGVTFTTTTLANGDKVKVVMTTDNVPCVIKSVVESSEITMTVYTPSVNAGACQFIYLGYGSKCVSLSATPSGFGGAVNYVWKKVGAAATIGTTATISVCPTITSTYSVTATNPITGCFATSTVTVEVLDVRCSSSGDKKDKIMVCHNGNTLCVAPTAVAAHLAHGDRLGNCSSPIPCSTSSAMVVQNGASDNVFSQLDMSLFPNPAQSSVKVQITADTEGDAEIHILDIAGKTVLTTQKTMFKGMNEVVLDISSLVNGIYMVQYKDALQNVKSLRMVKN